MTFAELFAQVRLEIGPDDQVEVLLWVVEEWLNDYFSTDPGWKDEPVRHPASKLYGEVIAALGEGLRQTSSVGPELLEKATAVAERFRIILNRVLRSFLERQAIQVTKIAGVKRASRRRSA